MIQADPTKQNVGIVAIREDVNTTDDSAAAKSHRRTMIVNGTCQVEASSEREQESRASAGPHAGTDSGVPAHIRRDAVNAEEGDRTSQGRR